MTQVFKTSRPLQNLHISFDEHDKRAVAAAFNAQSFSGKSPIITDYEAVIAQYFGVSHALACCNGTVAIELALRGLGIVSGSRVALPPTAPIMTILPVLAMGCVPVFYDVSPESFGPDIDDLRRLLSGGIDAIITVPMWGYPWDMLPVTRFCRAHGIRLIEDCAHSFGTEMEGRKFGTFGDAAAFSTHERKLVSTGEGGFCLTPHRDVLDRMRSWQHHGASPDKDGVSRLGEGIGSNYKLAPLCAALGISQFAKLDDKIRIRRQIADQIRNRLRGCDGLREFSRFQASDINGYAMVFWCNDEELAQMRAAKLAHRGIQSDTERYGYKPLYQEPAFISYARKCPNAERLIRSIITLPCHEGLSRRDVGEIASIVCDIYGNAQVAEMSS
jgi:perosamine synthetase